MNNQNTKQKNNKTNNNNQAINNNFVRFVLNNKITYNINKNCFKMVKQPKTVVITPIKIITQNLILKSKSKWQPMNTKQ